MRRLGRFIKNLNGEFITGEDVGTNPRDMEYIRMETQHVTGIPRKPRWQRRSIAITAQRCFSWV
jgi:leucine dehydrogenase